jgi:hypothetical protein
VGEDWSKDGKKRKEKEKEKDFNTKYYNTNYMVNGRPRDSLSEGRGW